MGLFNFFWGRISRFTKWCTVKKTSSRCWAMKPRWAADREQQPIKACTHWWSLVMITQTSLRQKLTLQSTFNSCVIFAVFIAVTWSLLCFKLKIFHNNFRCFSKFHHCYWPTSGIFILFLAAGIPVCYYWEEFLLFKIMEKLSLSQLHGYKAILYRREVLI